MHWLVDWHCRHYFVTKCHQQTIQRASLLCIYLSSNCYAFLFYFFFCDGILLVNISCNKWHIRWHADECGEITSDTCKVYISPVHTTSSWLNIMQPNHHTSCFRRPHRLILPFIGAGSYHSCLFRLHVATCLGATPTTLNSTIPKVLNRSTSCLPGQQANVQHPHDAAICSYRSTPRFWEILHHFISGVTERFCHFACGVFASMTFWHFINITQKAVTLSPESPFTDVCDLINPTLHGRIDPVCTVHGDTLKCCGCLHTTGTSKA